MLTIAGQFTQPKNRIISVKKYGDGNVNQTFIVSLDSETENPFILQQINKHVFKKPELIMENMRVITDHILQHRNNKSDSPGPALKIPLAIQTTDKKDYFTDFSGNYWRALSFIHGEPVQQVSGFDQASKIGWALGQFHNMISDLDTKKLHNTLPGFHITPQYLNRFDTIISKTKPNALNPEIRKLTDFVEERRAFASVLEDAKHRSQLATRSIHGDPKASNILFNNIMGHASAIIDLDTVGPGLTHYDIGDCLRSCCNSAAEDTDQDTGIHFDTDLCRGILTGYFSSTGSLLPVSEQSFIYDAIRLIPLELGIRFLTDHMEGDVYFKTNYQNHNLIRTKNQFDLVKSIESQEHEIRTIIRKTSLNKS